MQNNRPKPKLAAPAFLARLKKTTDGAEDRLLAFFYQYRLLIFVVAVTVLSFVARVAFWPLVSRDYVMFLDLWLDEIRAAGGFASLHLQIGNYTAPYHYLLAAMSTTGLGNLTIIKLTSSIADYAMAVAAGLVVWRLCGDKLKSVLCYAVLLCLPTVWLNSAAWGQCDAMYTTLLLFFIAAFLAGRKALGLLLFGFALSVKLQSIFLLPALLIFWLAGQLRIRHLLCAAVGYVLPFVPAMLASGSLSPLWRAYAMQAVIDDMAVNIPNLSALFVKFYAAEDMLIIGCILVFGLLAFYCWQHRAAFSREAAFTLVVLCACLAPFLLPTMRDRYYYPAEVLCLLYAFYRPRRFWLPILFQVIALPGYMFFLTEAENPFGGWLIIFVAVICAALFWDLRTSLVGRPEHPGWPRRIKPGKTAGRVE